MIRKIMFKYFQNLPEKNNFHSFCLLLKKQQQQQ